MSAEQNFADFQDVSRCGVTSTYQQLKFIHLKFIKKIDLERPG